MPHPYISSENLHASQGSWSASSLCENHADGCDAGGKPALASAAQRQLEGFKFKRQVPLEGYILDFVCFEARLIVEVDGFQHAESGRDLARDAFFHGQGFRILRFWNEEIVRNLDGACLTILLELRNTGE